MNSTMYAPDQLLTLNQAAMLASLSVRTLQRFIASGELKVVRIGRTIRIRYATLQKFIYAHECMVTA